MTTTTSSSVTDVKTRTTPVNSGKGYIVLELTEASNWNWIESYSEALNAQAAIRKAAEKHGGGTYVALPARSWKPARVTQKTETRLVVEEAS